jgi:hypothetical protein
VPLCLSLRYLRCLFPRQAPKPFENCQRRYKAASPAVRVPVEPDPNARENYCWQNVNEHVKQFGGQSLLGWAVWQHSNLFIEAEPHAVFDPANGQRWIDCTPNTFPNGNPCSEILFIPSPSMTRKLTSTRIPDNIRVVLVVDPRVREAFELASDKSALLNRVPKRWEGGNLIYEWEPKMLTRNMQLELRISSLLSAAEKACR